MWVISHFSDWRGARQSVPPNGRYARVDAGFLPHEEISPALGGAAIRFLKRAGPGLDNSAVAPMPQTIASLPANLKPRHSSIRPSRSFARHPSAYNIGQSSGIERREPAAQKLRERRRLNQEEAMTHFVRIEFLIIPLAVTAYGADSGRPVTFSKDIAPILERSCQNCHRPGSIAPMSLLTY